MEIRKFFTAKTVAEMFDIKPNTVWKWVREGKLRSTRLTQGVTRFDPADIDEFIKKGQA